MAAPASANTARATAVVNVALNVPELTVISQGRSNADNQKQTLGGQQITVDNAYEWLEWHESYGVLICRSHRYAVKNLSYHLRDYHLGSTKEKNAVVQLLKRYRMRDPKEVVLPSPLQEPFVSLGKPSNAFVCNEPECGYISINRNNVRIHCNKQHNWRSSAEEREHWHSVWVQTFFKSAGLQRYFTVLYNEEETADDQGGKVEVTLPARSTIDVAETTGTSDNTEVAAIAIDWREQDEKLNEALEVADAETVKTDHTLWFKKTGWPEHIAGCTLKHLSQASRLPNRDEQTLHEAVKLNSTLIEKCVAGLSSLDNETRRWLKSAKQAWQWYAYPIRDPNLFVPFKKIAVR
ncbi:hypothetical protein Q7P35_002206 [Cladosporium inversicolor]